MHLLALDRREAFGSINRSALFESLRKLCLPEPFVQMISAIYSGRQFVVSDGGTISGLAFARAAPWHPSCLSL